MTNPIVDLTSGTTILASTQFGVSGNATGKSIFISNNTTLEVDVDLHCDSINVGLTSAGANSTGKLIIDGYYKVKFPDFNPLATDSDILWASNGSYDNGSSGTTVYDLSGWKNYDFARARSNGTKASATAVTEVIGQIGNAWNFDGTVNGYITIPSTIWLVPPRLTFMAWVNIANIAGLKAIAGKQNAFVDGWELTVTSSNAIAFQAFRGSTSQTIQTPNGTMLLGSWHHLAVTYDGLKANIYFDGILNTTTTFTNEILIGKISNALQLAKTFSGGPTNEKLDEIYLFNRILSPNEIYSYFTLTTSAPYLWGLNVSEVGTVNFAGDFNIESSAYPSLTSEVPGSKQLWPIFFQGNLLTPNPASYKLENQSPGFMLQTSETAVAENFGFSFDSITPLMIDDSGGENPITTIIERRGNVSRVKKVGYTPRKVAFKFRLDITKQSGITFLRRFQNLASTNTNYGTRENQQYNLVTDKHILIGYQLTGYQEQPVSGAPWKIVDVTIDFTERIL